MPRTKYTAEEKYNIIQGVLKTDLTIKDYLASYNISKRTLTRWQSLYKRDGIAGLTERHTWTRYSLETKTAAVQDYLNHKGSLEELALKYGLRDKGQLRQWLKKYRYNETNQQLTATPSARKVTSMSRKTTFEERIQVVEYVIAGKHTYNEAAAHYEVSYQQARFWVLKAKEHGYEALRDRRGRTKPANELTELDAAKLEIRQLKAQLKEKEYLELFTKKLLEIQHRE